ncbi:hypothetical protein RF11_01329 [Thelohanellus kitauei]|uniref:Retrovirus-related Pol polyprotein n=1 Tax=Thelohanellus kitauei TaxID=669202 RepID=A0A0C2IXE5_THEKT|nr:hypothetical protein RF11_01329 [Thelohanellus kitauei]
MNEKLGEALSMARKINSKSQQANKTYYGANVNERKYNVGDNVLMRNREKGKLNPLFDGPYQITKAKHPVYKIRKLYSPNNEKTVHHNLLFPCSKSQGEPKRSVSHQAPALRRSTRITRPPRYLSEYPYNSLKGGHM